MYLHYLNTALIQYIRRNHFRERKAWIVPCKKRKKNTGDCSIHPVALKAGRGGGHSFRSAAAKFVNPRGACFNGLSSEILHSPSQPNSPRTRPFDRSWPRSRMQTQAASPTHTEAAAIRAASNCALHFSSAAHMPDSFPSMCAACDSDGNGTDKPYTITAEF